MLVLQHLLAINACGYVSVYKVYNWLLRLSRLDI